MNHINRIFASIAAIFVLAGLNSPVYASLVHYTYSGNTFAPIQIVNYPPFGPIYGYPQGSGNVHRLTIDFTLDDSLVP